MGNLGQPNIDLTRFLNESPVQEIGGQRVLLRGDQRVVQRVVQRGALREGERGCKKEAVREGV